MYIEYTFIFSQLFFLLFFFSLILEALFYTQCYLLYQYLRDFLSFRETIPIQSF